MKNPLLAELFCGDGKARLLSALFLADQSFSPKEFSIATGLDRGGVSRWLSRWSQVGIAERHAQGRGVTYRASRDPSLAGLRALFLAHSALARELLSTIAEILPESTAVALHGAALQWLPAARPDGSRPALGVLVLRPSAAPAPEGALAQLRAVGQRHGRPLSPSILSVEEFRPWRERDAAGGLAARPMVLLRGSLPGLADEGGDLAGAPLTS